MGPSAPFTGAGSDVLTKALGEFRQADVVLIGNIHEPVRRKDLLVCWPHTISSLDMRKMVTLC